MKEEVKQEFGHKLRVRVCGILIEDNKLLLVKHKGLGNGKYFWIPPGGGMHYGKSAIENLAREYWEETGLKVRINNFLFVHEFLQKPLHALELFFMVTRMSGKLMTGIDPELAAHKQIIETVKYLSLEEVKQEENEHLHQTLRDISSFDDLLKKRDYFNY